MSETREESSSVPAQGRAETDSGDGQPPEARLSALERQIGDMTQAFTSLKDQLEAQHGLQEVSSGMRLPGPVRTNQGGDLEPIPDSDPMEHQSQGGSQRGDPEEDGFLHGIGARFPQVVRPGASFRGNQYEDLPGAYGPVRPPPDDIRSVYSLGQRRLVVQSLKTPTLTMTPFNGRNFSLWKKDVMFVMRLNGHWDVISGKFLRPRRDRLGHILLGPDFQAFGVEEDIETWDALNGQACALLYSALGPEQKQLVSETSEAAEMWRILESTYMRRSHAHMAHVLRAYNSCKMKKSQTMQSYIMEVQTHLAQLREIGVQMDEKVTVLNLLNGLREDFQLDRKIMSRADDLSFDEAVGQLLSESLVTESGGHGTSQPVGNLAQASGKRGGRGRGRGKGRKSGPDATNRNCYACGDKGHFSYNCPKKEKTQTTEEGLCHVCSKPGHKAQNCPKRVKGSQGGAANLTTSGTGGATTPSS